MEKSQINARLKSFKSFPGHGGAPGFSATLIYNDVAIAELFDDARGGELEVRIIGNFNNPETYPKNKDLLNELKAKIKELPPEKSEFFPEGIEMDLDLFVTNLIAELEIKRDQNKGILVKHSSGYQIFGWKQCLTKVINDYPKGLKAVQDYYNEIKEEGKEILNTEHLSSLGIRV